MNKAWYLYIGWIATAALLGFLIAVIFAGVLRLPRNIYLIPYVVIAGLFIYAYVRWSGLAVGDLVRHHWVWGLVGGLLLAAFTVNNVLSQPVSPRSEGISLAFDLLWS
ncbi:MAG: hypothetical protein WCC12_21830, partial [Anaerolineales bacterium]